MACFRLAQHVTTQVNTGLIEFYDCGDVDGLISRQIPSKDVFTAWRIVESEGQSIVFSKDSEGSGSVADVQLHLAERHMFPP